MLGGRILDWRPKPISKRGEHKKEKEIKSIMTTLKANTDEMAKLAQSDINGVYSPFSPCDHIPPSMDQCAFESLLSPIRFVFSCYLFVSTA